MCELTFGVVLAVRHTGKCRYSPAIQAGVSGEGRGDAGLQQELQRHQDRMPDYI